VDVFLFYTFVALIADVRGLVATRRVFLGDVAQMGSSREDGMGRFRMGLNPNFRLQFRMRLAVLRGWVYLLVALTVSVLPREGRFDD